MYSKMDVLFGLMERHEKVPREASRGGAFTFALSGYSSGVRCSKTCPLLGIFRYIQLAAMSSGTVSLS